MRVWCKGVPTSIAPAKYATITVIKDKPVPPATTSGQAFNNLQSYTQGMKSPEQAATDANSQFGVNQAQQQVQGLRGAIQNTTNLLQQVAPSVMGRTANSLVTSAQADRQIQNEQTPLNTQLNTENQQYGNANQDYQNVLGEAQNQANSVLQGQQNQQSYLQGLYNDLSTKEQNAASMAEQQRQFNAQLAESQAARRAAGSAGASPSFGGMGASLGGGGSAVAPPQGFTKGTNPNTALSQMFKGYNPGSDKYYTENTVIPMLARLLQLNNPKQSSSVINGAAQHLAYQYRKQNFGQ